MDQPVAAVVSMETLLFVAVGVTRTKAKRKVTVCCYICCCSAMQSPGLLSYSS